MKKFEGLFFGQNHKLVDRKMELISETILKCLILTMSTCKLASHSPSYTLPSSHKIYFSTQNGNFSMLPECWWYIRKRLLHFQWDYKGKGANRNTANSWREKERKGEKKRKDDKHMRRKFRCKILLEIYIRLDANERWSHSLHKDEVKIYFLLFQLKKLLRKLWQKLLLSSESFFLPRAW